MEQENILLFLSLVYEDDKRTEDIAWSFNGKQLMVTMAGLEECKGMEIDFESFCEGIICYQLKSQRQAVLASPLKEEVLVLRVLPSHEFLETTQPAFGIGFGRLDGIYKVMCLESTISKCDEDERHRLTPKVMTFGSPDWRAIPNAPDVSYESESVFENGFVYWVTRLGAQEVLAFDVQNETFTLVSIPWKVYRLLDLGGKVALLCGSHTYATESMTLEDLETLEPIDFEDLDRPEPLAMRVSMGSNDIGLITLWKKYELTSLTNDNGKLYEFNHGNVLGPWKENSTSVLLSFPDGHYTHASYDLVTKTKLEAVYKARKFMYKTLKVARSPPALQDFHRSSEMVYLP